jgi:hypothetical protein
LKTLNKELGNIKKSGLQMFQDLEEDEATINKIKESIYSLLCEKKSNYCIIKITKQQYFSIMVEHRTINSTENF